jgi:RNA dependent RNA polymerase
VYLSGALAFKTKTDEGLFDFKLKPLQLDLSCRFHRKYGPSRFMVVTVPSLSTDVPSNFRDRSRSGALSESVSRWLTTTHEFLGRKWRVFYLEANKRKSKTSTTGGFKVHLFAVCGEDISERIDIHQLLNWHIPIEHNQDSTDLKLFQRLSLGLSKTISTFPLEASEFIRLPDPRDHAVMNDGCARMSLSLAKAIAKHIGVLEVPSVFQGRVAGAKGLWMVVPDYDFMELGPRGYCIEIADSQLKIKPHPQEKYEADEAKRTFEVLKCSSPGKPAALNVQLLTILHDRGVTRETLSDLLLADMSTFYKELGASMESPLCLRSWVQSSGMYSRSEEGIRMAGAFPDETVEQAIMLIESGFTPQTSSMLRERLCSILSKYLAGYVDRLQIRIPCSTFLFCIADPYGVLEPNEVHLSFSEIWKDSVSGFKESFVDSADILVARLPALLPSDVQRRRAVWKRELHHFKDVIVFPTKGDTPLASLLSGGDYDGDVPWICWDPVVVSQFHNAGLPRMPTKKECGLFQQNRRIQDVFSRGTSERHLQPQVGGFFAGCFAFNLNASYLGQCTLEHERVVYFDGNLASSNAIKLATLAGYLVDSAKQGDMLTSQAWRKIRREVSPQQRGDPAYKNERYEHMKRESNIVDYLKFRQAVPEKDRILTQFEKKWPQKSYKDSALCRPWVLMLKYERDNIATQELRRTLAHLRKGNEQVAADWAKQVPKDCNWATGEFTHLVSNICDQFRAIKPAEKNREFSHLWSQESDRRFGHWALLRASCIYTLFPHGKMPWYVAGEELCCIKAQSMLGGYRHVLNNTYGVLKCDSKIAKRAQQRIDDAEFEKQTFVMDGFDRLFAVEDEE